MTDVQASNARRIGFTALAWRASEDYMSYCCDWAGVWDLHGSLEIDPPLLRLRSFRGRKFNAKRVVPLLALDPKPAARPPKLGEHRLRVGRVHLGHHDCVLTRHEPPRQTESPLVVGQSIARERKRVRPGADGDLDLREAS